MYMYVELCLGKVEAPSMCTRRSLFGVVIFVKAENDRDDDATIVSRARTRARVHCFPLVVREGELDLVYSAF